MRVSSLLGNPLGKQGSACVDVMTTLHGSTPSLGRHVEGYILPKGMITYVRDPLTHPFLSYRATSTLQVSLYPIRISFLHVGASVDLQRCLGYSWVRLLSPQSHFGMIRYEYQFEYTWVVCLITFQSVHIEVPLYNVSSSVSVFIGVFSCPIQIHLRGLELEAG